jgi:four helix bundle protein
MNKISSYRDLKVWQKSMELVMEIYSIVKGFPKNEEYGLSSQIKRSAISVPSNIAEGYGLNHTKDYCRFLEIARGSLFEMETQYEIAANLDFVSKNNLTEINLKCSEVEKMLNSLISKLRNGKVR